MNSILSHLEKEATFVSFRKMKCYTPPFLFDVWASNLSCKRRQVGFIFFQRNNILSFLMHSAEVKHSLSTSCFIFPSGLSHQLELAESFTPFYDSETFNSCRWVMCEVSNSCNFFSFRILKKQRSGRILIRFELFIFFLHHPATGCWVFDKMRS